MLNMLVWLLLMAVAVPLALVGLSVFPLLLVLRFAIPLPFRAVGLLIRGVRELLVEIFLIPARVLRSKS